MMASCGHRVGYMRVSADTDDDELVSSLCINRSMAPYPLDPTRPQASRGHHEGGSPQLGAQGLGRLYGLRLVSRHLAGLGLQAGWADPLSRLDAWPRRRNGDSCPSEFRPWPLVACAQTTPPSSEGAPDAQLSLACEVSRTVADGPTQGR
jgi:hypothetical protein